MEEVIAWILVILAVLVVLPFVFRYIVVGFYWFLAVFSFLAFALLDELFSASFVPGAPWVMWLFWGAVIGAALAFWLLAPIYGLRHRRPLIAASPFLLMSAVMLLRLACR